MFEWLKFFLYWFLYTYLLRYTCIKHHYFCFNFLIVGGFFLTLWCNHFYSSDTINFEVFWNLKKTIWSWNLRLKSQKCFLVALIYNNLYVYALQDSFFGSIWVHSILVSFPLFIYKQYLLNNNYLIDLSWSIKWILLITALFWISTTIGFFFELYAIKYVVTIFFRKGSHIRPPVGSRSANSNLTGKNRNLKI